MCTLSVLRQAVAAGANLILTQLNSVPKPTVDGFMIRMAPNRFSACPLNTR